MYEGAKVPNQCGIGLCTSLNQPQHHEVESTGGPQGLAIGCFKYIGLMRNAKCGMRNGKNSWLMVHGS